MEPGVTNLPSHPVSQTTSSWLATSFYPELGLMGYCFIMWPLPVWELGHLLQNEMLKPKDDDFTMFTVPKTKTRLLFT